MPVKVYSTREAAVAFRPAALGGAGVALESAGLAANTGVMSAQLDLGTASRAGLFAWRLSVVLANPAVLGERVELVVSQGDAAQADGGFGAAAAAIPSTDRLRNLRSAGGVEVDQTGSSVRFTASGLVYLPDRTVALGLWNATGTALSATAGQNTLTLTPVPDEIQT